MNQTRLATCLVVRKFGSDCALETQATGNDGDSAIRAAYSRPDMFLAGYLSGKFTISQKTMALLRKPVGTDVNRWLLQGDYSQHVVR